jgi:hypothetical protein
MSHRSAFLGGVMLAAALAAAGCDAGGLLVVEGSSSSGGPPVVAGHSANDMVSGGTVAKSGEYSIVYTLGQATPNQNVATSKDNRLNGGLIGAVSGSP